MAAGILKGDVGQRGEWTERKQREQDKQGTNRSASHRETPLSMNLERVRLIIPLDGAAVK